MQRLQLWVGMSCFVVWVAVGCAGGSRGTGTSSGTRLTWLPEMRLSERCDAESSLGKIFCFEDEDHSPIGSCLFARGALRGRVALIADGIPLVPSASDARGCGFPVLDSVEQVEIELQFDSASPTRQYELFSSGTGDSLVSGSISDRSQRLTFSRVLFADGAELILRNGEDRVWIHLVRVHR